MRIVRANSLAGPKRKTIPPARPDWYAEWLAGKGKWVLLECDCIENVVVPACVTLLTGKRIYIMCPFNFGHGFQLIKKTLSFREVLMARDIPLYENSDTIGDFPPF